MEYASNDDESATDGGRSMVSAPPMQTQRLPSRTESGPLHVIIVDDAACDAEIGFLCESALRRGRVNAATNYFALQNDFQNRLRALKIVENPNPDVVSRPRSVVAFTLFAELDTGAFAIGPNLVHSRSRKGRSDEGRFIETIRTCLARELLRGRHDAVLFALPSSKSQDDSKLLLGSGFHWLDQAVDPFSVATIDELCDRFGDPAVLTDGGARVLVRSRRRSIVCSGGSSLVLPREGANPRPGLISKIKFKGSAGGPLGASGEIDVRLR